MKISDIRDLSTADLVEKFASLKAEYAELRIAHKLAALQNPMQIRGLRKTIARIASEITNRELQKS